MRELVECVTRTLGYTYSKYAEVAPTFSPRAWLAEKLGNLLLRALTGTRSYIYDASSLFVNTLLTKIVADAKPIVFFVPSEVLAHEGFTQKEMRWFLKRPQHMGRTSFVFGLYDLMTSDDYAQLYKRLPEPTERTTALVQAFRARMEEQASPE